MKKIIVISVATLFLLLMVFQSDYAGANRSEQESRNPKRKVIIFHAGSLTIPFKAIEQDFERKNPEIDIQLEPSGSQKAARKITDLKKPCDIMASADYRIIDKLLIPEYAEWDVRFAYNQMVLCYTDSSRYSEEVSKDNWYRILRKKNVVWGYADPKLDPCGYRALMVIQLAEVYYKTPGLYAQLISNFSNTNIRPKSVELISLLKSGNMDYAWEYRSVALQHDLKFIILSDEINLGNYKYDSYYGKAFVDVPGKKPGATLRIRGKSITYGITLIKDAPNKGDAIFFLSYLLDPKRGLKILRNSGQPTFIQARVPTDSMKNLLPDRIKSLVVVKN